MAGLLEKDIRLLWGTKQTLVILFAIAVAVAFFRQRKFYHWISAVCGRDDCNQHDCV